MTAHAGMSGYAPTVKVGPAVNPEQARYERVWQHSQYREHAPGEGMVMRFLSQAKPERDAELIDFGCGTGRASLLLAALGNLRVRMVDFAGNCLDAEVAEACQTQPERISFTHHDLTRPLPMNAAYGYCTDVMEHIQPDCVRKVLRNILGAAQHVWFSIALFDDELGKLIGGPLHLTVKPAAWWLDELRTVGALIHWHQEDGNYCHVYCTAWHDAGEVVKGGKINTDEDTVDAQVATNIAAGWQHVTPHDRQDREVVLLAGGPSMNECVDEIRELRAAGAALVTVNGAYGWALEHGLEPSCQIVLDARQSNARFVQPVTPYTKYLIASQAHPDTLAGLPRGRTWLWHSGLTEATEQLARDASKGLYFPVPGGSTVVLRALPLLRMLGFWRIHLFGFDSCVHEGAHHAYAQPENDNEPLLPVVVAGKVFMCTPWQVSQAAEFRDLVAFLGNEVECAVHGDGLIATMIRTGAELAKTEA